MQYYNNKVFDISIVLLGIVLIFLGSRAKVVPVNIPNNPAPIVVPIPNNPVVPDLDLYIYYDEYEKVLKLSKQYNKKIVLIFGADWCVHCKQLKKDLSSIYQNNNVLICIIDISKNKKLIDSYDVSGLPTSVLIDDQEKEISRKVGYNKTDYKKWLNDIM